MEQNIIENNKLNARSEFEAALAKLRLEFEQNLYGIDTLEKDEVERVLSLFNKRLVIFQYDFIKFLKSMFAETTYISTHQFTFQTPNTNSMDSIYSGIVASGTSMLALSLITVTQTAGWWIFATTTTTSLGAIIGSAVGISTGWATAGVGLVAGVGVGFAVNRLTRKSRRKKIRNKLVEKYTKEVEPSLREWAEKAINSISSHQELL